MERYVRIPPAVMCHEIDMKCQRVEGVQEDLEGPHRTGRACGVGGGEQTED
jgi:hypothetical protein